MSQPCLFPKSLGRDTQTVFGGSRQPLLWF